MQKCVIKSLKSSLIALLAGILLFSASACTKTSDDLSEYETQVKATGNAVNFMPQVGQLGDYISIEYRYKLDYSFFDSEGLALFVTYDEDDYNDIKTLALSRNEFLTAPVVVGQGDDLQCNSLLAEFQYKDFLMKVIPDEEYSYCPCKSFAMFGYRDDTNTVVFAYFFDNDLDWISKNPDELERATVKFMDDYFDWI